MIQSAQGSLVIVDGSKVYWKGQQISAVGVMVHSDVDSRVVKLRVNGDEAVAYAEMEAAGIKVRRVS